MNSPQKKHELVPQIIRFAYIGAQFIFLFVLYNAGITEVNWQEMNQFNEIQIAMVPMAIVVQVISLLVYFNMDMIAEKITNLDVQKSTPSRPEMMLVPHILCWAIMESSGILGFVLSLTSENLGYFAVFGGSSVCWLLFVLKPKLDS